MKVAIVGGGAAGFFSAIQVKYSHPNADVVILEKSKKVLAKVKISGGGRCNVTNACSDVSTLIKAYPRGGKNLRKLFQEFNTIHTREWFENRGVPLVVQEDGHIFPQSQDSQTIINCFFKECHTLGIDIQTEAKVEEIIPNNEHSISLVVNKEKQVYDKVIVTTGGSPKRSGLTWLEKLGHQIKEPVPSLFTFNMPSENITELMGVVVENTITKIEGEKLTAEGPLLITHWGMSGPAIIILSAFGARVLEEKQYAFSVLINWINNADHDEVLSTLRKHLSENGAKIIGNNNFFRLPNRLWDFLLNRLEIPRNKRCSELSKKEVNKLVNTLLNDRYEVKGKTTFKEEFVTCGGVSLSSVNMKTMESKVVPNLYFAGEVLDIDAITGGYNFQAAWTTGYIAGKLS
jgi:predicted Rossmann fold flavoprotein